MGKTTPVDTTSELIRNLPLRAQAKAFEHLLAGWGMPAELPPCGETSLDEQFDKAYAEEMTPFNLLADLLAEHDMRPEDLLTAAQNDPAGLRRFIDANLPGMFVN